jgi:hypothetical protein
MPLPLLEQLPQLRCFGKVEALKEQHNHTEIQSLSFEVRCSFLLGRETLLRESRRITAKLRQARLREQACIEDIDYGATRGLPKMVIQQVAGCD